jgi:hypothetical protein
LGHLLEVVVVFLFKFLIQLPVLFAADHPLILIPAGLLVFVVATRGWARRAAGDPKRRRRVRRRAKPHMVHVDDAPLESPVDHRYDRWRTRG